MFLLKAGILLIHFLLDDAYGQFPFPTPLDCNIISHEPCLLYGPGTTCGSDGKDYYNTCQLAQAWCSNPSITVFGDGSCAGLGYTRPYPYVTTRPPTTTQETSTIATFASTSDPTFASTSDPIFASTSDPTFASTSDPTFASTSDHNFASTSYSIFASTSDPLGVICSSLPHTSCPKDIEPLCGSDERTYINRCEFNKEVCQRPALTVKHLGFC